MSQLPYVGYSPPWGAQNFAPTNTQSFICYAQDGKIFRTGTPDGPQQIGVTIKVYEDLKSENTALDETCRQYYDALIEAGVIKREPTPEEIIKLQAQKLEDVTSFLKESQEERRALLNVIGSLKESIQQISSQNAGTGGDTNEHDYRNYSSNPRPIPEVENNAHGSRENYSELPKQPSRPVTRTGGTKPKLGSNKTDGKLP